MNSTYFIQDVLIKISFAFISALLLFVSVFASPAQASFWHPVSSAPSTGSPPSVSKAKADIPALRILAYYDLDKSGLLTQIGRPPVKSEVFIELPGAANSLLTFRLLPNHILPDALARRYADIQTFNLVGVTHQSRGKLEVRPNGVFAAYRVDGHSYYLEPDNLTNHYRFYDGKEQIRLPFEDQVRQVDLPVIAAPSAAKPLVEGTVRQYRLAIATTGEYSAKFGSNKASVLAELATVINRINLVFEVDMGVSFVLAANNDQIIFLDADTDPFANSTDDIDVVASVIEPAIEDENYDIGHVFTTSGGGYAKVGVVCRSGLKAGAATGINRPTGDSFYIELVAHEIGHQLGASHSFNSESGGCDGNRSSRTAWEPGSGSTIMSYAGLCGAENLQNNADDYFHIGSVLEYRQRLSSGLSGNCGEIITGTNSSPDAIDAGEDVTIPANSPFVLIAQASDPDGDSLFYNWEQYFLRNETIRPEPSNSLLEMNTDDGTRPLFRSWPPTNHPQRYLPRLQDVIDGTLVKGETYATTDRILRFRLSVRDYEGGLLSDEMVVKTTTEASPIEVMQPDSSTNWDNDSAYILRWDTGGTELSPVSCSQLDVLLSVDGGQSFPIVLAEQIVNNGEHTLLNVGAMNTESARLMLKCSDNVFYAVNPANFVIQITTNQPPLAQNDQISVSQDSSNNGLLVLTNDSDPDSGDNISILSIDYNGAGSVNIDDDRLIYSPAAGFSGSDSLLYTITDDEGLQASATVSINVQAAVIVTPPANEGSRGGGSISGWWLFLLLLKRRNRCAN